MMHIFPTFSKMKLDVLKKLEQRRRKRIEINKSMVDNIKYQADMRANIDREIMRVEKHRIQGLLHSPIVSNRMLLRHRYQELTKALE